LDDHGASFHQGKPLHGGVYLPAGAGLPSKYLGLLRAASADLGAGLRPLSAGYGTALVADSLAHGFQVEDASSPERPPHGSFEIHPSVMQDIGTAKQVLFGVYHGTRCLEGGSPGAPLGGYRRAA
jgi:hypothetical protein